MLFPTAALVCPWRSTCWRRWKPEVEQDDEDDTEEAEVPGGPTGVDLAGAVGATKSLILKALRRLVADGLVEKLSGRPARKNTTGSEA